MDVAELRLVLTSVFPGLGSLGLNNQALAFDWREVVFKQEGSPSLGWSHHSCSSQSEAFEVRGHGVVGLPVLALALDFSGEIRRLLGHQWSLKMSEHARHISVCHGQTSLLLGDTEIQSGLFAKEPKASRVGELIPVGALLPC